MLIGSLAVIDSWLPDPSLVLLIQFDAATETWLVLCESQIYRVPEEVLSIEYALGCRQGALKK